MSILSKTKTPNYCTIASNTLCNKDYTVFGEVIEGLDVIDKIAKVQKDRSDRPLEDIKMTVSIIEK